MWNSTNPIYRFDSTAAELSKSVKSRTEPLGPGHERKLRCRICQMVVTDDGQRMSVDGEHVHNRSNPAGITFCFGCFRNAPGCSAFGTATGEFSWFTDCRWQVAVCNGCGEHLGWSFRGTRRFFGLILARLVADDEQAH